MRNKATACRAGAAIGCFIILMGGCDGGDDDTHPGGTTADVGPPDVKCPDDLPPFTASPDCGIEADDVKHHSLRVRLISANGLDLSLFQFDTDQSFAVFLLNADGTIYGRFGTRSDQTLWTDDVSIEGLGKALEGALA